MEIRRTLRNNPFFSICIPQYNRTSFLIEVCKSLSSQTFHDFEVCISDDCSTDGRTSELIQFLEQSKLSFVYYRQPRNLRYDGNLRASISLAGGQYIFLLGNDDSLASPATLEEICSDLQSLGKVGVAFTNYGDFKTGITFPRVFKTEVVGSGPTIAMQHFRNFSFVSGVILDRAYAQQLATPKWDGSEMYQMFIGCRIIAAGALLATINTVTIRKDIQLPDEKVDSYASRPRPSNCKIKPRHLPLGQIGQLVADAIEPYTTEDEKQPLFERIFLQLYLFTYPYWLFEYRRVQSWRFAVGVCLGLSPHYVLRNVDISLMRRVRLSTLYGLTSLLGLTLTVSIFQSLKSRLHLLAKQF